MHYDTAWINSTEYFSLEEKLSPVVVKWGEYDIRSSTGGAAVEARAIVNEDLETRTETPILPKPSFS